MKALSYALLIPHQTLTLQLNTSIAGGSLKVYHLLLPKATVAPSEHMHQSPKIRDGRNAAEVSIRGMTDPEAGSRQATREYGTPWTPVTP